VYFRKWEPPFQTNLKRSSSSPITKAAGFRQISYYMPKYTTSHTRKPKS